MKLLKAIFIAFFSITLLLAPTPAFAQGQQWAADCIDATTNVPSLRCIPDVFGNVINAALMFAGTVAAFLIIYSGIKLVTSGGDPKQVGAARQILTYSLIGLVVVLGSFAIIYFISYITGAECIETFSFDSCQ